MVSITELFLPPEINSEYYFTILKLIRDGINNTEMLAKHLGLSKENTSRAISVLKKLNLIERQKKSTIQLSPLGFIILSQNGFSYLREIFPLTFKGSELILKMLNEPKEEQRLIEDILRELNVDKYEQRMRIKYAIKRTIDFLEILGIVKKDGNIVHREKIPSCKVSIVEITDFIKGAISSFSKGCESKIKRISLIIESTEDIDANLIAAFISGALAYFLNKIKK